MSRKPAIRSFLSACALTGLAALFSATGVDAQTTTGSIRGVVTDEAGAPVAGASITATNTATNVRRGALSGAEGFYNISGLAPGVYEVEVTSLGRATVTRTVRVMVGQTLAMDVGLSTEAIEIEGVTVEVAPVVEMETAELATNITQEQIESIPLHDRNFLQLAMLAPGIRRDGGSISSGALSADAINVFIDGASFKNDLLKGGVVGQDASKGNPFPQIAVREFRVITQQYKAEYQKATSAIITATTKSGTNEWRGEIFGFGQNQGLIARNAVARATCDDDPAACPEKPELGKGQLGASIGGPIIQDELFFFGAYEGNYQNRAETVVAGDLSSLPADLADQLASYEGTPTSPFRSSLYFGKLTYVPDPAHRLEASVNIRDEYDIRSFGGRNSYENAEHFNNDVNTFLAKHQYARGRLLNEAMVSFQRYHWLPIPLNQDLVGKNYHDDVDIKIGGRCCLQDLTQDRLALRNDVTYSLPGWYGEHVLKAGATLDLVDYDVIQPNHRVPQYHYYAENDYAFPTRAVAGFGDPNFGASNTQFGIYAQDDWTVTDRLTLNLGVRWDYESNMLNNDFVTPDSIRQAVEAVGLPLVTADNFTDGDDRPAYLGMIQPRFGFSYDLTGEQETVLFGGFGIYYDRNRYGYVLSERSRLTWNQYTFLFSEDGTGGTLAWDPKYLTREGLREVLSTATAPNPEVFLLNNNTVPPKTHQYSFGVRQAIGDYVLSTNYVGVRGYNHMVWHFANRDETGARVGNMGGFRNILVNSYDGRTWYDALYVTAQKPYTAASRWGAQIAYTLGWADEEVNPGGVFSGLRYVTPADFERYPSANDERHHVVANGMVGLPFDVMLSGVLELGSGRPYNIFYGGNPCTTGNRDCVQNEYPDGSSRNSGQRPQHSFIIPDAWAFRNLDLRLEKTIPLVPGQEVSLIAEVFNVVNWDHFRRYVGRVGNLQPDGSVDPNPDFGAARGPYNYGDGAGAPRRFQFGLRYSF